MTPGMEPVEILARIDPTPGRPDRLIGRRADGAFVLLEQLPTGVVQQLGKASEFYAAVVRATAALDGDERALKSPDTIHALALALVGACFPREAKRLEDDRQAAAASVEADLKAAAIRAAKAGGAA